jgi:hypothetical protein
MSSPEPMAPTESPAVGAIVMSMQYWPGMSDPLHDGALVEVLSLGVDTARVKFYTGVIATVRSDLLAPVHDRRITRD